MMIKKLVIAAAFAASMAVGIEPAEASAFICMQKLADDMKACQGKSGESACQMNAEIQYTLCLQALYPEKPPIDG